MPLGNKSSTTHNTYAGTSRSKSSQNNSPWPLIYRTFFTIDYPTSLLKYKSIVKLFKDIKFIDLYTRYNDAILWLTIIKLITWNSALIWRSWSLCCWFLRGLLSRRFGCGRRTDITERDIINQNDFKKS